MRRVGPDEHCSHEAAAGVAAFVPVELCVTDWFCSDKVGQSEPCCSESQPRRDEHADGADSCLGGQDQLKEVRPAKCDRRRHRAADPSG